MAKPTRFTIFDVLDSKGYFDSNPANPGSRTVDGDSLYSGPQQYPKMLYHPEGLERVTVPPEIIVTPMGPKEVGEQRELVWQIAATPEDEKRLLADGWHLHPSDALRAAGKAAPAKDASQTIADLQAQIAALQLQVNGAKADALASARPTGAIVRTSRPEASPANAD